MLKYPELLIHKIFRQRYCRNISLLGSKPKQRDSFVWKSFAGVLDIFKTGLDLFNGNEWSWKYSDSREYSAKSGYELANNKAA